MSVVRSVVTSFFTSFFTSVLPPAPAVRALERYLAVAVAVATGVPARLRRVLGRVRSAPARWVVAAESGQTTAEYALVILGAAAVATLLITWATKSHAVGRLFDVVIDKIVP